MNKGLVRNPKSEQELIALARGAVKGKERVIMQAGHFLLYFDEQEKRVIPLLKENLKRDDLRKLGRYSGFPFHTWCLGLRMLDALDTVSRQIMIVVNDWQHIKNGNRSDFYASENRLPESYQRELDLYRGKIELYEPERIKSGVSTAPYFGEMNLRNRYQRRIEKIIMGVGVPGAIIRNEGGVTTCLLPDKNNVEREVYCSGKTGDCAGEVAEMIYDVSTRGGATCFINLYPSVCQDLVERGIQLSEELLKSRCDTVLNIGFHSTGVESVTHLFEAAKATVYKSKKSKTNSTRVPHTTNHEVVVGLRGPLLRPAVRGGLPWVQ